MLNIHAYNNNGHVLLNFDQLTWSCGHFVVGTASAADLFALRRLILGISIVSDQTGPSNIHLIPGIDSGGVMTT